MDSRSSVLKTNHLYNTNTRTFKIAGNLTIERYGHVLVKTEDVYVFTVGGADGNSVRLKTDEKLDKIAETWSVFDAEINNGRLYP